MLNNYIPPILVLVVAGFLTAARSFYARKARPHAPVGVGIKTRLSIKSDILFAAIIIIFAAILLLSMGRTPTYKYGPIRLWSGNINSNQNSQQVADPYTFTHIVHGPIFYAALRFILPSASLGLRAISAVALESAWEVFENTDMVINRYRAATISLDYYGDSVINSVFDILTMILAFFLAWRLPTKITVLGVILIEILLAVWIRDNLFLNILMLIYPLQLIKNWQSGL